MKNAGNLIIRNMVLDGLIVRFAINGKNLPRHVTNDIEYLIKTIWKQNADAKSHKCSIRSEKSFAKEIFYFHSKIAMNFNLIRLSMLCCDKTKSNVFLENVIKTMKHNKMFTHEILLFLRAILLSSEQMMISFNIWKDILDQLLSIAKNNSDVSGDTIYFVLYYLAKETDGMKQLELLRGLTSFASIKKNIPLILNTYRSLSSSASVSLRILAIDLHTRLWTVESRTYQFLHSILVADEGILSSSYQWEMNVAKANAIKEICSTK